MKRRIIAAVWITGATVPLLLVTVYLIGCCALPFHSAMHKLMPICDMAIGMMRGEHHGDDASTPARDRQEPAKRITTLVSQTFRLASVAWTQRVNAPTAPTHYRSFISLGATRCDRDVGLHVLVETFLI